MLKKICLFTLTLLLLTALNVPPTAAEKPYLEVQVNGDGSVTFFTRGVENRNWNINDDALRIYKQSDEIQQLNPSDPAPVFSMLIEGTFESGKTFVDTAVSVVEEGPIEETIVIPMKVVDSTNIDEYK